MSGRRGTIARGPQDRDGVVPVDGVTAAHGAPSDPRPGAPALSSRAIRVSLAASSAQADLEPCVVDVDAAGRGRVAGEEDRAVRLRRLDPERAILEADGTADGEGDGEADRRVLLLPFAAGRPGATGARRREVVVDGWRVEVEIESEARAALRTKARRGAAEGGTSGPVEVRAMIPGVVFAVAVAVGDTVSAGQKVVVVEAMKMQNELRAPRDGTVERVAVATGDRIEVGDLLLVIA